MARRTGRPGGVFIAGESPLVEEYAAACIAAGMTVEVRFNSAPGGRLPAGARRALGARRDARIALELTNTSGEAKRKNLRAMDRALPEGTPLLSASAAITVAEQSGWIAGWHRLVGIAALPTLLGGSLVELAGAPSVAPVVIAAAREFFRAIGKEVAIVGDTPGMVLPRILCMLVNEAHFALGERIAPGDDIDTAMKLGTNYPRGPLEWGAAIGYGHVRAVLEGLQRSTGEERYRTAPLLARRGNAFSHNVEGMPL
ncbi:MAG TPA: 3-hydroxyacyl-CoA dehydrogenase family protein [Bacteroidota bacterium]|nr:3-hydroxyacyl-CoA dehydrogenase family protein [Bacteroidota bacterium]